MSGQRRYPQVAKAVYERPWAIQPAMLAVLAEVIDLRISGSPLTDEEIETRVAAAQNGPRNGAARAQGVAVIPIYGVISPRMDLMTAMSGGTSVEGLRRAFREAQGDPDIGGIVLDIDSPGGAVDGIFELADEIRAARGVKPIVAVSNTSMASAAYAIGSAADEIVVTPSGQVGSVGVVAMRPDQSGADEKLGVTYNVITAGGGKDTYNPHVPLSEEGRDEIQSIVDDYYGMFVGAVTKSRNVPAKTVREEWGAKMFTAQRAVAAGLADRVDTLDAVVRRMVVKANRSSSAAAHALAAAGLTAQDQIGVLMSTLPISEQAELWSVERERIAAHYDEKARLRELEGRSLSSSAVERLEALAPLPESGPIEHDLDTDEPEEADQPQAAVRPLARFEILEAATRGGYQLPEREVTVP